MSTVLDGNGLVWTPVRRIPGAPIPYKTANISSLRRMAGDSGGQMGPIAHNSHPIIIHFDPRDDGFEVGFAGLDIAIVQLGSHEIGVSAVSTSETD